MTKKKVVKFSLFLFAVFILAYGSQAVYSTNQYKVLKQKATVMKMDSNLFKFKADIDIVGLYSAPCMCSQEMMRYHHAISPKNMSVYIFNHSQSVNVNVKVTLEYFSLVRDPGKWKKITKNVTINKNSTVAVAFWLNTYYDIIKIEGSKKIKIKAEITNSNVTDPHMANNLWESTECEYYIQ